MSTTGQSASPSRTDNFKAIFQTASREYERVTGKPLDTHPFSKQLDSCDSPEAVSNVLRTQAQAFSKFRKGDEKLMAWLDPTVNILFTFSATLGEVIGLPFSPAKTIFTGISLLLAAARDVVADHNTLIRLFERIHFFLQRLNRYTGILLTDEFTELLGNIMAQILSVLALSTKMMTEKGMKKILKRFTGKTGVEDALQRLDSLTQEENLMVVVRNLEVAHHVDGNVEEIKALAENIGDTLQRNQLQEKLQTWLSPPDPSLNHSNACKTRHDGTARWFIQGSTFREWKTNGSLLWIHGNPGVGKSILCSAIIEDIWNMYEDGSALVAYYYFDFKDVSKRHVRGLLASLLFQLCDDSERCRDILHHLFNSCRDGSERPSDTALTECLRTMVQLPGQLPIFIIMDALDECPSNTGTPSPRDEVLDFVENLVGSSHSNLFVCITSRPEQDIKTVLEPLTSPSYRVSVHEESGQREDINNYIRSFVHSDRAMRRWREEDKELVINTLSERAGGMFRWVFCQLDTLRRCFPSSIRKTLNDLPTTLNETYVRTLEGIPKEKKQHAYRLFRCLIVAMRPLRVEELAEIFAIEFDLDGVHNVMEGWRPENPEEAILSACSTLIAVNDDDEGSKIAQFSHFSVREFLTSHRLRTSEVGDIRDYHVTLDAAHILLAQACLAVLLQLDEKTDKTRLAMFPLTLYAAQHWFDHVRHNDVASRVQDAMEQLFNPSKPYFASWVWIHDVDQRRFQESVDTLMDHPSVPEATALYYAVSCGLCTPAKYLISTHGQDVNAKCGTHGTPLHAASSNGHISAVALLLDHGADVNMTNNRGRTALCKAFDGLHLEVMRSLLGRGADPDAQDNYFGPLTHSASGLGQAEVVRLLLQHNADVNAATRYNYTPLHWASMNGHANVAQVLLDHGADVNAQSDFGTPLYLATTNDHLEAARLLLTRGADVHIRAPRGLTPFQASGDTQISQLLLEHGAEEE